MFSYLVVLLQMLYPGDKRLEPSRSYLSLSLIQLLEPCYGYGELGPLLMPA